MEITWGVKWLGMNNRTKTHQDRCPVLKVILLDLNTRGALIASAWNPEG